MINRLKKLLPVIMLMASPAYAMVPYQNEGIVNLTINDLQQVIINDVVYEITPQTQFFHKDGSNIPPDIDALQSGQRIGFIQALPETNPPTISDIWILPE